MTRPLASALLSLAASVGPGMRTVLVTTSSAESVRAILRHFDLEHAFDFDHGVLPSNVSAGDFSCLRPRIAAAMSVKASLASDTVTRITKP